MAWLFVFLGGIFEIVWAVGLKQYGFSRLFPTLGILAAMAVSVFFLELGMRTLPVGTAYAVWTSIGVAGAVVIGILFLGDPASFARIFCLLMIACGVIGLKLLS